MADSRPAPGQLARLAVANALADTALCGPDHGVGVERSTSMAPLPGSPIGIVRDALELDSI